jgi:tRNA A-37 threonylcarbamoyl transferase component Bud32
MPVETPSRESGWCQIRPESTARFADLGLCSARDFLNLPGVVVGGHVGRNVSRVDLGRVVGYLKREHRVRWRDRWRNLLTGFGAASMSLREWSILRILEANDLPGPTWLACGEADGQAFLLLEGVSEATDLRRAGHVDSAFAAELGRTITRLHAAGIDQPDLFAKHFLIDPATRKVTILDWQRAVRRAKVGRAKRIAALGTFLASCPPGLLTDSERQTFLRAYLEHNTSPERERRTGSRRRSRSGLVDDFVRQVTRAADRAAGRPSIRSQHVVSSADQELVRIGGERVCAIPEVARDLTLPDVIAALYDPANDGRPFRLRDGRIATLRVRRYVNPLPRWLRALRGKAWRSAELKTARLLFLLERHGIAAPRLLAYGQSCAALSAGSFVLAEAPDADPIRPGDRPQAEALLNRLHEAGCVLDPSPLTLSHFGTAGGHPVVVDPTGLRLCRKPSRRTMARDQARLAALFRNAP